MLPNSIAQNWQYDESGNAQGENSECLGLLSSVAIGFHLLFSGTKSRWYFPIVSLEKQQDAKGMLMGQSGPSNAIQL